jgi:long-subunit fatty acid transport protein
MGAAIVSPTWAKSTDFRVRLATVVNKEVNNKLLTGLKYEHRFDQNLTSFDKAFIEPMISYKLSDAIRLGVGCRVMYDQNEMREQTIKQRFSMHISYSDRFDDFKFKIKTTLQYGFDDLTAISIGIDHKLVNRYSLKVEYDWFGTRISPYAEYEIFYHINSSQGGIINQNRMTAGAEYKLSKVSNIKLYYLYDNEFNVVDPVDANVFGVAYGYRF